MKAKTFQAIVLANVLGLGLCGAAAGQNDAAATAVTVLARKTLAKELHIEASTIAVVSTDPHTWPDSSLGCGKPGSQSVQVLSPGFAIIVKARNEIYRIHATEKYAIVCAGATRWGRLDHRGGRNVGLPLKNLNAKIDEARQDLAKKLGISAADVAVLNLVDAEWPDSTMGCPASGEQIRKQPTKGYRIPLSYRGRVYAYHTDLNRVRACPPIETQ